MARVSNHSLTRRSPRPTYERGEEERSPISIPHVSPVAAPVKRLASNSCGEDSGGGDFVAFVVDRERTEQCPVWQSAGRTSLGTEKERAEVALRPRAVLDLNRDLAISLRINFAVI